MADQDAVAKDKQFTLISILPDVCLTPSKNGIPVPYPLIHTMDQSMHCSPNVFFRGKPAYLHNESFVDNVRGDEAGAQDVAAYMRYYNLERLHTANGDVSPVEYENCKNKVSTFG